MRKVNAENLSLGHFPPNSVEILKQHAFADFGGKLHFRGIADAKLPGPFSNEISGRIRKERLPNVVNTSAWPG